MSARELLELERVCRKTLDQLISPRTHRHYSLRQIGDEYELVLTTPKRAKTFDPMPTELTYRKGELRYKVNITHKT
jgi:hypothetical protein